MGLPPTNSLLTNGSPVFVILGDLRTGVAAGGDLGPRCFFGDFPATLGCGFCLVSLWDQLQHLPQPLAQAVEPVAQAPPLVCLQDQQGPQPQSEAPAEPLAQPGAPPEPQAHDEPLAPPVALGETLHLQMKAT
jgi:hypothetical protein